MPKDNEQPNDSGQAADESRRAEQRTSGEGNEQAHDDDEHPEFLEYDDDVEAESARRPSPPADVWKCPLPGPSNGNVCDPPPKPKPSPICKQPPKGPCFSRQVETCKTSPIKTAGPNGDETTFPGREGNYHKGLQHTPATGLVNPAAYDKLLDILNANLTARQTASPHPAPGSGLTFEDIPLCLGRRQVNPQAGLAADRQVAPDAFSILQAPSVVSHQTAVEALELYWQALLRDVPFTEWAQNQEVRDAVNELNDAHAMFGPYPSPRRGGIVTPDLLFRGCEPGSRIGPYVSQFLVQNIPFAAIPVVQRIQTAVSHINYMTRRVDWLNVQDGEPIRSLGGFDGTRRYIRNIRDLTAYVHTDFNYEAYAGACLILLGMNTPFDEGNPYRTSCNPNRSRTQIGFTTFGSAHVLALVSEVTTRAHRAAWYQKWFVHRRVRPEAYGGLVEYDNIPAPGIRAWLVGQEALKRIYQRYDSYLLPQAYPEGSPTHPSYPSGHATVAGACVTILKAFFEECTTFRNPVEATADGLDVVPYRGDDAGRITVGGELNKLATNISIARDMAGVHWRTDYTESRCPTCIRAIMERSTRALRVRGPGPVDSSNGRPMSRGPAGIDHWGAGRQRTTSQSGTQGCRDLFRMAAPLSSPRRKTVLQRAAVIAVRR